MDRRHDGPFFISARCFQDEIIKAEQRAEVRRSVISDAKTQITLTDS
jgi:hypothetical protein